MERISFISAFATSHDYDYGYDLDYDYDYEKKRKNCKFFIGNFDGKNKLYFSICNIP